MDNLRGSNLGRGKDFFINSSSHREGIWSPPRNLFNRYRVSGGEGGGDVRLNTLNCSHYVLKLFKLIFLLSTLSPLYGKPFFLNRIRIHSSAWTSDMKNQVWRYVTPCRLMNGYWNFGGSCLLLEIQAFQEDPLDCLTLKIKMLCPSKRLYILPKFTA